MVLKKSNSIFNSGTTQKFVSRLKFHSCRAPSEVLLSFILEGIPFYEKDPPTGALQKIYDYLGFPGLGSKIFQEPNRNHHYLRMRHSIEISLNKQQLWLIPGRIDKLMKEKNFLEGDRREGLDEIHIDKEKSIANGKTIFKGETCVLKVNNEVDDERKYSKRVTKRRPHRRSRGLQRPHLLALPARNEDEDHLDHGPQTTRRVVKIMVEENDHVDARIFQNGQIHHSKFRFKKNKSKKKRKSFVNGKNSYHYKMYNPPQLRHEIQKVMEFDIDDYDDNLFDENDVVVKDCENYYHNPDHNCDFLITSPEYHRPERKRKRREGQRNHNENYEQLVNVNSASSKLTIKYPKGSFQIIEQPHGVYDDKKSDVSFENDFVLRQKDEIPDLHVNNSNGWSQQAVVELPIAFNTFENYDNFVEANIMFPKDVQVILSDLLQQPNGYNTLVNDYSVTFGNCFPPVFSVDLEENESGLARDWSLVGTSWSDMSRDKDFKWEVTLKHSKAHITASDNVKNNFVRNIDLKKSCALSFHELVQIAMESVRMESSALFDKNIVPLPKKNDVSVCNLGSTLTPEVCLVEEAVRRLRDDVGEKVPTYDAPSAIHLNSPLQIHRENVECDICLDTCDKHGRKDSGIITLLPCNHSFCHECWRSHFFYKVTRGENEIKCMHTECKQVVNETTMKALIPQTYFSKVHSQRLERCIDKSSLCQWCPASKCDRVTIIAEESQHINQFGCPVVCDCNRRYCFSCQSTPHWPMSCNQAAVYNKLLYNLGDALPEQITWSVDLKPCPGCKYPIEKNEGCPHMTCRMCGFNFCWKCLQSTVHHRVWQCQVDEKSKFVTYHLQNEVVNKFPLEFFTKAVRMRRKLKSFKKLDKSLSNALNKIDNTTMKIPFIKFLQMEEKMIKSEVIRLTMDVVSFLVDSYGFLEKFFVLFSFSLLNKDKSREMSSHGMARNLIDRLLFTAGRLEMLVVEKSPRQLLIYYGKTSQMHLNIGHQLLETLKSMVSSIQKRSKNVPTGAIGKMDPKQFIRYK